MRTEPDAVVVAVHLQPGARRTALAGEHGERLKIALQAPPVEGRANRALIEWLAARLRVSERAVSISAGKRGRDKTVRVSGVTAEEAVRRLKPE